ncbi:hypothetical protein HPB49_015603 [Dermacentor silvarum]|uniref:Uncharacterized protein n=1 Tax=Dermacentor silvarum TaxID=543639 RepID=A0ACB8CLJ5_DERSI|nr:hypothetical protein HPB49_015603 [Dermacentor silvarum]
MSLSRLSQIFHVINASVVNAWLEYRSDAAARGLMPGKQLDLLDFTLHITEALARADSRPKVQKRGRPSLSPLVTSKKARYAENRPVQDVSFDQYYQSIPAALPTTIAPALEQGVMSSKFSACRDNIEWKATSDEQLAALTIPPLVPQPTLSGDTAQTCLAFC